MILLLLARSAFSQELPSDKIIIRPEFSPQESANSGEPGIALAISGGGARGLAVIGVLKALERENIKIKFIAGVSMGSVIGGLYACGYSANEIEDIAHRIDWGGLFSPAPMRTALLPTQKGQAEKSLFTIRFQGLRPVIPKAITSGQKLSQMLEQLTARGGIRSNISYDYLSPPIRIVCTDLLTGERVILSSGSLSEAMRASIAVPVAFTPVEKDGRLLIDGGLVDPIPVDIAAEESGCPVVAVDVTSDLLPQSKIVDIVDIADQTTTIMSMEKKREALALADLYIAPDLGGRTAGDFSDIDSLIMLAERATEKALPSIKRLLADTGRHPENYPAHRIAQTEIAGLGSMPRTFFATAIRGDTVMTKADVEANLRQAYDSGYLAHAWAEILPESSGCRLIYHLEDNPRISDVKFQGATIIDSRELFRIIRTQRGTVLNRNFIQRDRQAVEDHYIDAGYSLVRATAIFDTSSGLLIYKIDEGRINRIEIEGTKKTRKWVVSRHIPFSQGDIFEQERGRQAIEEIFATGLFESAKLVAVPDSEGITLVVKVAEKPYNLIRGGAHYDLEYQSRGFIDIVADNVFGGGQQMFLSANIGEKRRSLAINFQSDRILKTLFTNNLRIDYGELKLNQYLDHEYTGYLKQTSYGIDLTPGRQIPQLGTIMIAGQLRKYRWNEPGKLDKREFTKISVGIKSLVDSRDALSFPDHGKYHVFDLQFAGDIHDEKSAYTRFFSSLEAYYAITRRLNFHPRLTVGASSDFMPYFDEFSLGGLDNFLGLYEDEHLGDKLLLGSLELRQKIGDRFYILARYNAGNIWNKLETVQLSKLIHGGGAGIAFKTPLGPVEAWYGRTDDGLDAFYFNIGYRW